MASNIEQMLIEKVRALPHDKQSEVLEFVDNLCVQDQSTEILESQAKPIWEVIQEIAAQVPEEQWDRLPQDGAEQHDHYLYGAPKR